MPRLYALLQGFGNRCAEQAAGDVVLALSAGSGCRIYESRPAECRTFLCMWLLDARLGPEWKPDRSRLVLTNTKDANGLEVYCDPGFPAAWRKEPYYSQILQWAKAARPHDGTVVIRVGNRMTLIAPEGEFPFGQVSPGDQMVREFSGERLTSARIVKASKIGGQ